MKTTMIILSLSFFVLTACAGEWQLIWSDEFDYNGLPDSSKWNYEEGFVRNEESQYYTRARWENARVEKGILIIEARKEKIPNPRYRADDDFWRLSRQYAEYTSASLTTFDRFSFRYGRVEIRAKVPSGNGVWPALWMMGMNRPQVRWPACGEIDIMEYVGVIPDRILSALHYKKEGKHRSQEKIFRTPAPYKDFHLYSMEWYPDRFDFFYDDSLYYSFNIDDAEEEGENPYRKPQYLIMNLALGGKAGGKIDDSIFPRQFIIDYVRIYRLNKTPSDATEIQEHFE